MPRPYLAVVVPAYNEQSRLASSLSRIKEYLDSQNYSWTVVVVNDGSTDETPHIAEQFAKQDPRFQLISYLPNKGKGHAVRTGMMSADADYLLLCDADLAAPIEEVEKLFQTEKPVAIGSRPLRESHLAIRQPWYRELAGRVFNKLVQLLAVKGIQDTQCGFKLFRCDAAKSIFSRCRFNRYSYDFEALMLARALNYEIAEVPIRWSHQQASKVRLLRDGLRMLIDLIILRLTFSSRLKSQKQSKSNS